MALTGLGFGFHRGNDDYKVVRIVYLQGGNGFNKVPPEVELYEVKTGSWREYGAVDSWIKLFSIDLQQGVNRVLGTRRNGELLVFTDHGNLVSYDPDFELVKDVRVHGDSCVDITGYVESLVLLSGVNRVLGYEAASTGQDNDWNLEI
ncbi:uncharacterized protein LOC124913325 [Impatiens glandulifera]|uniref:uncharacterized protein LOC124913325 n=1 Tax=Impatiens glandulifera TaxID=253017 RepID=UPI001FB10A0F|nr:uncharacterized protein LOC124913325 [Impatiens glandulifera]